MILDKPDATIYNNAIMGKIKYTKDILDKVIPISKSWAQVCRLLGSTPASGSQQNIKKRAIEFGVDFSHFTGRSESIGRSTKKKSADEYINSGSIIKSARLKKALFDEGIKEKKCEMCGLSSWLGEDIALELHHINGNHYDNNIINLMVVCPNCHAKFDAKKRKVKTKERRIKKHGNYNEICKICGTELNVEQKMYCSTSCATKANNALRKERGYIRPGSRRPPVDELERDIRSMPFVAIGKKYGVSDNAVRKWARYYNLPFRLTEVKKYKERVRSSA